MDSVKMLQILIEVAEEVIRPRFRSLAEGEVEQKAPGDFVTVADREAEKAVISRLEGLVPDALIVGEEGTFFSDRAMLALPEAELAYTIDPIDGTANFVAGKPDYGMMVAETRKGAITRAWIWQPEYQRSYVAELGAGVYRNDEQLSIVARDRLPIGVASNRRFRKKSGNGEIAPISCSSGSAAFDYPNVIEGVTDFVYYRKLKPWDHCPGALLVHELGGLSQTLDGEKYSASTVGEHLIAAASPEIWNAAAAAWKVM